MKSSKLIALAIVLAACDPLPVAPASAPPAALPADFVASYDFSTHPLIGPGGDAIAADPCPEGPDADALCGRLVSARRISWFGYLARWMQVLRTFGVPESNAGNYANYPAGTLNLGVNHPDRALMPLVEGGGSRSQYVVLHEVLGEPSDTFGVEESNIPSFRAQHASLITAAAVKQACRMSSSLAERLANHLATTTTPQATLAVLDTLITADHGGGDAQITTIRGFKPNIGYLAFGRRLSANEIAVLDATLGAGGSARNGRFATFRVALTGLMCSTMSLVE